MLQQQAVTESRWVVTGASGFIGSRLVEQLHAAGASVVALDRAAVADLRDAEDWYACLQPGDRLVHLAEPAHRKNRIDMATGDRSRALVEALGQAAHSRGARLVYLSSISVLQGYSPGTWLDESLAPKPESAYGEMKAENESVVRATAPGSVILRPPMVYGVGAPGNFRLLERALRLSLPLPFSKIDNSRCFISIAQLVEAILRVAVQPAAVGQLFHVADMGSISTKEFVIALATAMRRRALLFPVPGSLARGALEFTGKGGLYRQLWESLLVDTRKMDEHLAWRPPLATSDALMTCGFQK